MAEIAPYRSQRELLADELSAMRDRLRAAKAQLAARATGTPVSDWPAEILEREAAVDARLGLSDAHATPLDQLRARFDLSATEMLVLRVLIAHELCPIARSLIRDLNSEHLADPTTDSLRRVVYGVEVGERDVWREHGVERLRAQAAGDCARLCLHARAVSSYSRVNGGLYAQAQQGIHRANLRPPRRLP